MDRSKIERLMSKSQGATQKRKDNLSDATSDLSLEDMFFIYVSIKSVQNTLSLPSKDGFDVSGTVAQSNKTMEKVKRVLLSMGVSSDMFF